MIEIEIKGLDPIIARLGGIQARLPELAQVIGEIVRGQTRDRFAVTKTDPDGAPWAPWAHRYPKSGSLLVRSGALASSIYNNAVGLEARVGTNIFYAGYHEDGTRKMPARPFLGLSPADETQIIAMCNQFLDSILEDLDQWQPQTTQRPARSARSV